MQKSIFSVIQLLRTHCKAGFAFQKLIFVFKKATYQISWFTFITFQAFFTLLKQMRKMKITVDRLFAPLRENSHKFMFFLPAILKGLDGFVSKVLVGPALQSPPVVRI